MKNVFFPLACIFLFVQFSFSQQSTIKNYPLKDYVAPDIKFRMFDLGTNLSSSGLTGFNDDNQNSSDYNINNQNSSSFNVGLNYSEYINTRKHQGISYGSFHTAYNFNNFSRDTIKNSNSNLRIDLSYGTQNRFYNQNKVFLGIHGFVSYLTEPLYKSTGQSNSQGQSQQFSITPYISVGKGRVEPVESARRAMDILISLEKYNRLAINPDTSMIDSLARVANRIRYKRFYDNRFKKIYQLEELDRAIQNLGLVDSLDIVYFANLNDIWNFAPNFNRGSGTRFEGGIIPDLYYSNSHMDYEDNSVRNSKGKYQQYGIYGFISFNRIRPVSYAWQSNLMIDLTFGYNNYQSNYERKEVTHEDQSTNLKSLLNASWQFGFFPNTRTFAGITPFVGLSFDRDLDTEENTIGVNTGFRFEMYYYVSPRLRFTFNAAATYTENFDFSVPTPFWNSVNYNYNPVIYLPYHESEIAFPIDSFNSGNKKILYSGSITLAYAIF